MSQLTKKAIVETTVAMAQVRPLNKITVRDIVEACGITRNTFYYHFHDIFEVVEYAVREQFEHLRQMRATDPERALFELLTFCFSYKKMWINLYRSIGHEYFATYFTKQIHCLIMDYLQEDAGGADIDEQNLNMICMICEEAILGVFLRLIKDDSTVFGKDELEEAVSRFLIIFEGHARLAIENCRRKSQIG